MCRKYLRDCILTQVASHLRTIPLAASDCEDTFNCFLFYFQLQFPFTPRTLSSRIKPCMASNNQKAFIVTCPTKADSFPHQMLANISFVSVTILVFVVWLDGATLRLLCQDWKFKWMNESTRSKTFSFQDWRCGIGRKSLCRLSCLCLKASIAFTVSCFIGRNNHKEHAQVWMRMLEESIVDLFVAIKRQRGDLNPCGQSPMDF